MYLDITELTISIDWQMVGYGFACLTMYLIYKVVFSKGGKKKGKK